jgi:hypothetical protein
MYGGSRKIYKTEMQDDNNFYTLIKNKNVSEGSEIEIFYLCNDEKNLIETGMKVGDGQNE